MLSYLAVQESEAHFGAVDHAAVVLHINAALFPAADGVVWEWRIPFYILYRLEVFRGHLLGVVRRHGQR